MFIPKLSAVQLRLCRLVHAINGVISIASNIKCLHSGIKAVGETKLQDPEIITRKFNFVFKELDYIAQKVHRKQGFLFFKSHVYTIEQLLASPHHQRIYALTEKIGDDTYNWHKRGQLSRAGRDTYYSLREDAENQLHAINQDIIDREPTWWEKSKGAFTKFIELVLDNLPDLVFKLLPFVTGRLFGLLPGKLSQVFLPRSK
jgi:hypothetical protein